MLVMVGRMFLSLSCKCKLLKNYSDTDSDIATMLTNLFSCGCGDPGDNMM